MKRLCLSRQMHHEHAIIESIAKEFGLQLMVQLESTNSMKVGYKCCIR